jgi:diguanylate cyclase (GGDEF)-like protein
MKRLVAALMIVLGGATAACAEKPDTLRSLREIHALTNAEASHLLPVAFEATVTYYRDYEKTMFVQDGDLAIYVQPATTNIGNFVPGDRVRIEGTTQPSFRPFVLGSRISLLGHGNLPAAIPADHDQLIRAEHDCMVVKVRGVVRSADLEFSGTGRRSHSNLKLSSEGGIISATVDSDDRKMLTDLLDDEVEITGPVSGKFEGKMQQTGILLHVSSYANVKVTKGVYVKLSSLPETPMDEIIRSYHVKNLSQRLRVRGTITYYEPGSAAVLQSGTKSLWIRTQTSEPMRIGDLADATGFPDVNNGFLVLTTSEIYDTRIPHPIAPQREAWQQLTTSKHLFDLVSIEGKVVTAVQGPSQDEYALVSDGYKFSAIYHHPAAADASPVMKQIPVGAKVRVTGICVLEDANPFDHDVPFNILMRTPDDIVVLAKPSWLNVRNLITVVSVLVLLVLAVTVWGWMLEKKVRQQTAALSVRIEAEAALERAAAERERLRSRILEDINGAEPLAGILEQIAELTSHKVDEASCWCEVTDGARLGQYPQNVENLHVVQAEIPARSGPPLGRLLIGFPTGTAMGVHVKDSLEAGAKLASLAIETRRLYADLRHRSDFDLLTDIHNRGSLDRLLDARIEEARQNANVFGLIYIDLDEFKQVNDLYGHQVGDLYLQEVASRMKRQLRSHDLLARLGGDEFAVLVPVVRSRAEVEEIALRLEHSFDEPFAVEGYVLRGSASVGIALYPEDATTKDSLLCSADAAMYVAKHTKKQTRPEQESADLARE